MASFCKQCAEDMDFPADYTSLFEENGLAPDGIIGFSVLCETCGPAFIIDDDGTCGAVYCYLQHGRKKNG